MLLLLHILLTRARLAHIQIHASYLALLTAFMLYCTPAHLASHHSEFGGLNVLSTWTQNYCDIANDIYTITSKAFNCFRH
jgi:hypothetical protein